jgi:hypothetical protein
MNIINRFGVGALAAAGMLLLMQPAFAADTSAGVKAGASMKSDTESGGASVDTGSTGASANTKMAHKHHRRHHAKKGTEAGVSAGASADMGTSATDKSTSK